MSLITITIDPDEAHPEKRHYESDRFVVFWQDGDVIRFAAVPPDDEEWDAIMGAIEDGELGILEED